MILNDAGRMVQETWHDIPKYYLGLELDVMQIMPNHLHGIIVISEVGTGPCACPNPDIENGQAQGSVPTRFVSLSDVIKQFKTLTTKRYIDGVRGR